MTSNAGIGYINIDRTQYNRSRSAVSNSKVGNSSSNKSVPVSGAQYRNSGVAAKAKVSRSSYVSSDESITLKDVLGYAGDAIGAKIAEKRRVAARERANAPIYSREVVASKTAFPIGILGYIIVFSAIAMFLVLGNTKINEATLKVDNLNSAIAAEMNRGEILDSSLNARNDISYIEEYAVNNLGMVKSTDVAKTYVSISGEDKIVVNNSVVVNG